MQRAAGAVGEVVAALAGAAPDAFEDRPALRTSKARVTHVTNSSKIGRMSIVRHPSASAFLAATSTFFDAQGPAGNLAYSVARSVDPDRPAYFATLEDHDWVHGVAVMTPPRSLIASIPIEAAGELVDDVLAAQGTIHGVMAAGELADEIAGAVVSRVGCRAVVKHHMRLHALEKVAPVRGAPGHARVCEARDEALALTWTEAFVAETGIESAPQESFLRWLAKGDLRLWIDEDGTPVSMAAVVGRSPGGARIGGVDTPPQRRRRGYAEALVAEISQRALESEGVQWCALYTDLTNPTSNALYARIGYRPVLDVRDLRFE